MVYRAHRYRSTAKEGALKQKALTGMMLTVHEVSQLSGLSVRALHHYDEIGLLTPQTRTQAGYRLYSESDLERLQQILLFRELEFPLKDIRRIMDSPSFDRTRALQQQLELLTLKREHIDNLIDLTRKLMGKEAKTMSFDAFDTTALDDYAVQAKKSWGNTPQWAEFEEKSAGRDRKDEAAMGKQLMELFVPFASMAAEGADPGCDEAKAQAAAVQSFITQHFYTCTNEIFAQLGKAYGAGGDFTRNIDEAAGKGAAEFASRAIAAYCAGD